MPPSNHPFTKIVLVIGAIAIFFLATQWFTLNWGRLELGQPSTITVTGKADGTQVNQVATFYAGVVVNDPDREIALRTANEQVAELIRQVKEFGIPDDDIKTENINVYEYTEPEPYLLMKESNSTGSSAGGTGVPADKAISRYPAPNQPGGKVWQASNNLTITLRDVSRASELATIITNAGATTVSGPNFTTDDTTAVDRQLLQAAMQDAREKATLLLEGTGQHITRIVTLYENESYTPYPMYAESRAIDVGTPTEVPIEPGSQTLYKSVTIIFEISR